MAAYHVGVPGRFVPELERGWYETGNYVLQSAWRCHHAAHAETSFRACM